jgi:DNA-binding MarR family transcriptional regulator
MPTRARSSRPAGNRSEERWAELADLILIIAREISFQPYGEEHAVHLTQSEGSVMRYLVRDGEAAPSAIASVTGLRRTNLSTVLRALEAKGLIERRGNAQDARGVVVSATQYGVSNYHLVRKEWARAISIAADGETASLAAARELLEAIADGMTRHRQ